MYVWSSKQIEPTVNNYEHDDEYDVDDSELVTLDRHDLIESINAIDDMIVNIECSVDTITDSISELYDMLSELRGMVENSIE